MTEILSFSTMDLPEAVIMAPLDELAKMPIPPNLPTTWDTGTAAMKPTPKLIPMATIHVRTLSANAWMDGSVQTLVENVGDFAMKDVVQKDTKYQEIYSAAKKYLELNDSMAELGTIAKNANNSWKIGWKVEGVWNVAGALIEMFRTGKMKVKFTCSLNGNYTRNGKIFGTLPTSRLETFAKSYTVEAYVPVQTFNLDWTL